MFNSTNLRLNYPRTETRYDERILEYHGVTFYHVDDDPRFYQEYDASLIYKDGSFQVYGDKTSKRSFKSLDACLHYIVGGDFGNWRDNWKVGN